MTDTLKPVERFESNEKTFYSYYYVVEGTLTTLLITQLYTFLESCHGPCIIREEFQSLIILVIIIPRLYTV